MLPPFCPNPRCAHHHDSEVQYALYWRPFGYYMTKVVGPVRRFKCRACGKGFSERTFSIDYYTKRTLDYREIHRAISQSESVSSVSRHLSCTEDSVQNRIDRLARSCLALQSGVVERISLSEHLVADGFESFDRSQYFPNQINLLLGKSSQFLYGFTHMNMRRKGRMSPSQKETRKKYDASWKPKRGALLSSFARLLSIIPAIWDRAAVTGLELWTDEHKTYPRALEKVSALSEALASGELEHKTVSSRAKRTKRNPLFSVNYYDRELRKDLAAFRRESTCYTRNASNGLMRFSLHMVYHNYRKLYRIKDPVVDFVHAEATGLPDYEIEDAFKGFYEDRRFLSKLRLSDEYRKVWLKKTKTPLKEKDDYLPQYACVGA